MVMCMLVIVALPIVMGAWSMAFLLGQHVEYYTKVVVEIPLNVKLYIEELL